MPIHIPKLSAERLQAEAARVRSQQQTKGGGGDYPEIRYFNFPIGTTRGRLLTPSPKGIIEGFAMVVGRHWNLPGERDKETCISDTFPDCGYSCPIDPVLKKYKDEGIDVWQMQSNIRGVTNMLIRGQEKKLAQLTELPLTVYNWLLEHIVADGVMNTLFDPRRGVDLHVTRTEKAGKKGKKKTVYTCSWSPTGPAPVVPSKAAWDELLASCYEVTEIYKAPDLKSKDEKVRERAKEQLLRLKATANILDRKLAQRSAMEPTGKQERQDEFEAGADEWAEEAPAAVADEWEEPVAEAESEDDWAAADEVPGVEEGEDSWGAEEPLPEEEEQAADDSGEDAILEPSGELRPCFGHTHADKKVEYDGVQGGLDPAEYRCVTCPDIPSCTAEVQRKYPSHYTRDMGEIIPVEQIRKAMASKATGTATSRPTGKPPVGKPQATRPAGKPPVGKPAARPNPTPAGARSASNVAPARRPGSAQPAATTTRTTSPTRPPAKKAATRR